jgi:hypothetical protein
MQPSCTLRHRYYTVWTEVVKIFLLDSGEAAADWPNTGFIALPDVVGIMTRTPTSSIWMS